MFWATAPGKLKNGREYFVKFFKAEVKSYSELFKYIRAFGLA